MIYIWYFIILPIIYIICNIFYFIYKVKFFPWKSFNRFYVKYWITFDSYRLNDIKKTFYDGKTPLATFLIGSSKGDTLLDAMKIAEEYLRNIGSKETVNTELIVVALKKIYYGKSK